MTFTFVESVRKQIIISMKLVRIKPHPAGPSISTHGLAEVPCVRALLQRGPDPAALAAARDVLQALPLGGGTPKPRDLGFV